MESKIEVLKQTELLGQQFEVYGTPQEPLFKAQDNATIELQKKELEEASLRVWSM